MRSKMNQPIDATKYDIRVLWTGLKEEHVSADAGVVEGYPLDPPDTGPGWLLLDWGVESLKDTDRYWTLWIREKTALKKKAAKREPKKADAAKPATEKPAKRGRPRKSNGATTPEAPETPTQTTLPNVVAE